MLESALISALMVDVDGVLVCGRPSDGRPWASTIEGDLGISAADLKREFFIPHWNEVVIGRSGLADRLKPALAKIAPHLSYDELIAYWFENDARINTDLLEEIGQQRDALRLPRRAGRDHRHLARGAGRRGVAPAAPACARAIAEAVSQDRACP